MSLILSVIVTFWENETINETFITIMSLTLLIIIEQIIKYYTFKAEEIRRKDHLDNSLGSVNTYIVIPKITMILMR